MSSHPEVQAPSDPGRLPMTLPLLMEKKRLGDPIVMVTAYDYPSARAAEAAGVDLVLVGDSAATTVLGYSATTPVVLEDMLVLARAVRRGLHTPLLIGDLPFGSYEVSDEQAITTSMRMVKDAGCDVVKLEGGGEASVRRARAIVGAGIPVMGHVGLTPQTSTALGGWKAQGRTAGAAARIAAEALALQDAGCFAIVFEAIPSAVTEELMPLLDIPVIGIGAGPATDGQVLVFHDLLGIRDGLGPRFVKRYANLQQEMNDGVIAYAEDVRSRRYPGPEHTYSIDPAELADLRRGAAGLVAAAAARPSARRRRSQRRGCGQPLRPRVGAVADPDVGCQRDPVGDSEQLPDLCLGGHEQRRHGRRQALGAQGQQQVLHERVDRGASDDALAVKAGVGDREVLDAHPDDEVDRDVGKALARSRRRRSSSALRRASNDRGVGEHPGGTGLLGVGAPVRQIEFCERRCEGRRPAPRAPASPAGCRRWERSARRPAP